MSDDLARELGRQPDEAATLDSALTMSVEMVPGCVYAGVAMVARDGIETAAATSPVVEQLDALQSRIGEGPALGALEVEHSLVASDLARDRRWPTWAHEAGRLGVRSMMAVMLYADRAHDSLGVFTLYGTEPEAFDSDALILAESMATQVAVAVTFDRAVHHRELALFNRTVIGQATGIVMVRHKLSAETAFSYLRRLSQEQNRKLSDIARDVVADQEK